MPTYTKSIHYNPADRDFTMELNGELVGYAQTFQAADATLDALITDLLRRDADTVAAMEAEAAAELDARPTPAQVAAACESLAEEYRDAAAGLESQGLRAAAKDLRAAARAADKAAFYALQGADVARWVGASLMVRSATEGGVVYAVRVSGCCCKAAEKHQHCWHVALFQGSERARDRVEFRDDYADRAA